MGLFMLNNSGFLWEVPSSPTHQPCFRARVMWLAGNSLWVQNVSFAIYLQPHSCCSRHSSVNLAILPCSYHALRLALSHHTLLSPPWSYKATGSLASQDPWSSYLVPPRANWWELNQDNMIPSISYEPPMICHIAAITVVPSLILHLKPWAFATWCFSLQPFLHTMWKFGHPSAHNYHLNDLMKDETH